MYEEAVGVPLIIKGPGIPVGRRVATPVSLVDVYPTIIEAVGEESTLEERNLPGTSLLRLLNGEDADRTVFSEYHAVGSMTGIFMVRFGALQIRPLRRLPAATIRPRADPMETRDLALEPNNEVTIAEGERRLRAICDPAKVSAQAFDDQERRIRELGGAEAVLKRGSYPYTPAPGEAPRYS